MNLIPKQIMDSLIEPLSRKVSHPSLQAYSGVVHPCFSHTVQLRICRNLFTGTSHKISKSRSAFFPTCCKLYAILPYSKVITEDNKYKGKAEPLKISNPNS
jgi:hypothetical protein